MEQEYTTIRVSKVDHQRIMAIADANHRNARQQVLMWLDAHEALMADIDAPMQRRIDEVKGQRD